MLGSTEPTARCKPKENPGLINCFQNAEFRETFWQSLVFVSLFDEPTTEAVWMQSPAICQYTWRPSLIATNLLFSWPSFPFSLHSSWAEITTKLHVFGPGLLVFGVHLNLQTSFSTHKVPTSLCNTVLSGFPSGTPANARFYTLMLSLSHFKLYNVSYLDQSSGRVPAPPPSLHLLLWQPGHRGLQENRTSKRDDNSLRFSFYSCTGTECSCICNDISICNKISRQELQTESPLCLTCPSSSSAAPGPPPLPAL